MVSTEGALGAAATLVAVAFALSTLDRWLAARRRHELAWTISLAMFAIASAALWWGAATGWSPASFRVFFLFGAVLNVPWLALGTVYLLGGRRLGDPTAAVLALLSAFAAGVLVVAPLEAPVPSGGLPKGSDLFGPLPRVLAAVGSGVGALVLIGGALLSAWRLWRGQPAASSRTTSPGRLALGNVLIAVGALVLSGSGTLAGRVGELEGFEITLLTGISVLFVGFLVATSASAPPAVPAGPAPEARRPARSAQDAPQDLAAHPAR
jgi:hypothetical protein